MASPALVHDIKLSSIGSGAVTGQDVIHNPTNIDLVTKLHYLKFIYYFASGAVDKLSTQDYKERTHIWMNPYYVTCGRFRRAESGRPYIKCNDCGVRLAEAQCEKTLDEWLEMKDGAMEDMLLYGHTIGPEMHFSPLVYLQLTKFKNGGLAVGLSWAHVLGDAFVAADFMALLGHTMAGHNPAQLPCHIQIRTKPNLSQNPSKDPLSVKRVDPVGDHWKITNNCKMEIFSFNLTAEKVSQVSGRFGIEIPAFESICAVVWKSVAKTRIGPEPKIATICKNGAKRNEILGNGLVISIVEAERPIGETNLKDIGGWICSRMVDDRASIEETVERDMGLSDFILYGANLTFLNLEDANIYGFDLGGQKPISVSCIVDGVGEEGVVLVIPDGKGGKVVTLIMPESEVLELKSSLKREFEII